MSILKKYINLGFSIIPVDFTLSDPRPVIAWNEYKQKAMTAEVAKTLFKKTDGVAVICGAVSGGLRCIDVEMKSDSTGNLWNELSTMIKSNSFTLWQKLVIETTKSMGYHLHFKYQDATTGDHALAMRFETKEETDNFNEGRKDKAEYGKRKKLLIEERGEGDPINIYPSPKYNLIQGTFDDLQELTKDEYELLLEICREFNQVPKTPLKEEKKAGQNKIDFSDQPKIWETYNDRNYILDIMTSLGWKNKKSAARIILSKPERGIFETDASIRMGENKIRFWGENCGYPTGKSYTPFEFFKEFECNGDIKTACQRLEVLGYGNQQPQSLAVKPVKKAQSLNEQYQQAIEPTENELQEKPKDKLLELIEKVDATKFDITAPRKKIDYIMTFNIDGAIYNGGAKGGIIVVSGFAKSRKTGLIIGMAAAAISQRNYLNCSIRLGDGKVMWFDTEQSIPEYEFTQWRVFQLAGIDYNLSYYESYSLREFSANERLNAIKHKLYNCENISIVIIDGIVDLIEDYNNVRESKAILDEIMQWCSLKNIMLITALHKARSTGGLMGHLGGNLLRKASLVIDVVADEEGDYSTVNFVAVRGSKKLPHYTFTMDSDGIPCLDLPPNIDWNAAAKNSNQFTQRSYQNNADLSDVPF